MRVSVAPSEARRCGDREADAAAAAGDDRVHASQGSRVCAAFIRWPPACRSPASAARARLRSSCALPGQVLHRPRACRCSPAAAAACSVQYGSARCGRASAHRSARPAMMMLFTWSGSKIAPTAIVAMPTSLRMRSANGVWYMRPYTGFASRVVWPDDTSIRSAPALLNSRAMSPRRPACCRRAPSRARRSAPTSAVPPATRRAPRGTLRADSGSGSRAMPPYSSSRRLVSGDRKVDSR